MLEKLNDRQRESVVNTEGPMLILAGAGSGKTRTLTSKIAYLIEEKGVDKRNILAITFTNKAAQEMKERLARLLDEDISGLWVGTFHSIGVRILRRGSEKLGYGPNFTIYDRDDQKTLLKEIYKDLDLSDKTLSYNTVLSLISRAKNQGVGPEAYTDRFDNDIRNLMVERIYRRYEEKKEAYNAFDFDDLIVKTIDLLEKDREERTYYQKKFEYIFVDEYQDTNASQYKLVKLLSDFHKNICVVGDSDQSIYGWRGADISNILDFEKDFPGAKTILLEENYRSSQEILNAANKLIENNKERKEKNLFSRRDPGKLPVYKKFYSQGQEARGLASKVQDLVGQGYHYKDMAVLYRTNAQSRSFEEAFIHKGIPYQVIGGLKFYDRKEIKDILAYLRIVANPEDNISTRRIINEPKRGIGARSLEKISRAAAKNDLAIMEYIEAAKDKPLLTGRGKKGLEDFRNLYVKAKDLAHEENDLYKAVEEIVDLTTIVDNLKSQDTVEARSRLENIESFLSAVALYARENPDDSLEDYLSQLSLMTDLDKTEEKEGLSLMTIHSAKGLEYPVVFVTGLEEGLFPSKYSIDEGNIEEERRLFYVAITRAEDELYLSSSESRMIFGKPTVAMESRFIDELEDTIEKDTLEEGSMREMNTDDKLKSNPRDKSQNWDLDYMKYSIQDRRQSLKEKENEEYKLGEKVKHRKFGIGTIVSAEGNDLVISFEKAGLKKLRGDIAPLERV